MKENDEDFADWVKKWREFRGLSKKDLADKSGLSASQIGRYELRQSYPTAESCNAIADVLGRPREEAYIAAGFSRNITEDDAELERINQDIARLRPGQRRMVQEFIRFLASQVNTGESETER